MNKVIGKVVEVSIPEYENGKKIDVMYSNKIAFKVEYNKQIIDIIEEQNEENAQILKDSLVEIKNIDNKLTISLVGEEDE